MIGFDRDHRWAQLACIAHHGGGLDAERLGRVAGGDGDGGIRQGLHDDDRVAAQGRAFLLLATTLKGVEVEEQPLHRNLGR